MDSILPFPSFYWAESLSICHNIGGVAVLGILVEHDCSSVPMVLVDGKCTGNLVCNCQSCLSFLSISGITCRRHAITSLAPPNEVFPSLAAYFWHPTVPRLRQTRPPLDTWFRSCQGFNDTSSLRLQARQPGPMVPREGPSPPMDCQDTRSGGRAGPHLFQPFHQHGQSGHDGGSPRSAKCGTVGCGDQLERSTNDLMLAT